MKPSLIRYSCHWQSGRTACRPYAGPAPTSPDLRLTAIRNPGLPFNGRQPRNPCNYVDHCSFTEGWKAELSIVPDWFRTHENETENVPVSVKLHLNGQAPGASILFYETAGSLEPTQNDTFSLKTERQRTTNKNYRCTGQINSFFVIVWC